MGQCRQNSLIITGCRMKLENEQRGHPDRKQSS